MTISPENSSQTRSARPLLCPSLIGPAITISGEVSVGIDGAYIHSCCHRTPPDAASPYILMMGKFSASANVLGMITRKRDIECFRHHVILNAAFEKGRAQSAWHQGAVDNRQRVGA